MGIVYEAEQVSLRRRVALKVLPFAAAMDPRQLQRFRVESQAAACLHHPHIVPVHGVGCERGVHYYAMQLIEGQSLAATISELRRLDRLDPAVGPAPALAAISTTALASRLHSGGVPGRPARTVSDSSPVSAPPGATPSRAAMPGPPPAGRPETDGSSTRSRDYVRGVARLALQAAEALDHAHARGILHRDIKPGNLLLDGEGRLWVADFGLAQIRGDDRLTRSGDIAGTLRYMSPEQALGRRVVIDGRTDIYSLGVTLYELLTLRCPFDGRDRAEILRRLIDEEPPPPRRLNPAVPADLETIVLKATAKDPAGRYPTAGELADDLRRFLEDRPIRARRPSVLDRASKWAWRHRPIVAAAALGLALTILALAASTAVIARGRADALRQLARVRAERRELAAGYFEAYEHVGTLMLSLQNGSFDPKKWEGQNIANNERAVAFQEKLAAQLITDPEGRFEAARCYYQTGEELRVLGRLGPAEASQRRAIALLREMIAGSPDRPEFREALQVSLANLGLCLAAAGRPREAEAELRQVLAIAEALPSLPPARTGDPARFPGAAYTTGTGLSTLTRLVVADRPGEAADLLRRVVAICEGRAKADPRGAEWRRHLRSFQLELVRVLSGLGESDRADVLLDELVGRGRADPKIMNAVAWFLATVDGPRRRDPARAVKLAEAAVRMSPGVGSFWNTLGVTYYRAGDWSAAITALERSRGLSGGGSTSGFFFLAMAHARRGDRDAARDWFDRGVSWIESHQPAVDDVVQFRDEAADLLGQAGPWKGGTRTPGAPPGS